MKLSSSLLRSAFVATLTMAGIVSCGRSAPREARPQVIYGDDNRRDVFEFTSNEKMKDRARATAGLIDKSALKEDGEGFVRMETAPYGESMGLCRSEPYYNQPTGPWCSGFLVAPNLLVTAGHCVKTEAACKGTAFVFGFGFDAAERDITHIATQDVYFCGKLVKQQLDGSMDFAVVELDRPVLNRTPLEVRRDGALAKGDEMTVIGHPSGLPTKISDRGVVRSVENPDFFVTNLDTYGGNSGSAVINSTTGLVEGILVRGDRDFVFTSEGCSVSNRCDVDSCRGEDVSRASQFVPYLLSSSETPVQ